MTEEPNNITELLISIRDDKDQDAMKIDKAWYQLTEKAPVPMLEETRQDLFNILYHNYKQGHYAVGYNPHEKKKGKYRK